MVLYDNQEEQTAEDKSYSDTSREDFNCGKYKKVDIVQKSREKRSTEDIYYCGATIIADK